MFMDNYVISRYSFVFKSKINNAVKYLIYTSTTNSFVEVSEHIYTTINTAKEKGEINTSLLSEKAVKFLKETKIVVSPTEDDAFVRQCEIDTYIDNFASSHMSLSLAPTLSCNFVCPYCYEKYKPNNRMTDGTINDLVKFINGHENVKTIGITWYGGEPLLAFETIKKITEKINSECCAKLTSHDIVTNGYNFNDSVIDFFKVHPLKSIQITIDGSEDTHNKLRKLANGKGTYRKIISNIHSIIKELLNTKVIIRVNVGKDNQDEYPILCQELHKEFSDKISVYPGFIRVYNERETDLICNSMEQKDVVAFYEKLENEGSININYYPNLCRKRGCVATCSTAYVVDPFGKLYKCWNDIGDEKMVVGNIANEELIRPDLYNQYMIEGQWTSDNDCKKCFFLPICSGGCPWQRIKNKFYGASFNLCSIYKEGGMDEFLQLYYNKYILDSTKVSH